MMKMEYLSTRVGKGTNTSTNHDPVACENR